MRRRSKLLRMRRAFGACLSGGSRINFRHWASEQHGAGGRVSTALEPGGASVYAIQSKNPIQAPLTYASPTQLNFQVPSGLTPGIANFAVALGGANSLSFALN